MLVLRYDLVDKPPPGRLPQAVQEKSVYGPAAVPSARRVSRFASVLRLSTELAPHLEPSRPEPLRGFQALRLDVTSIGAKAKAARRHRPASLPSLLEISGSSAILILGWRHVNVLT